MSNSPTLDSPITKRRVLVTSHQVKNDIQFYLVTYTTFQGVTTKVQARYNDFQDFHNKIAVYYDSPVPFPKPALFSSTSSTNNNTNRSEQRSPRLQDWLSGMLGNKEHMLVSFMASLQRKYDIEDQENEPSRESISANSSSSSIPSEYQKSYPLYICGSGGVSKYDPSKKAMTKVSDCSFDSAPHCYKNKSLIYHSEAHNRLRLLYFPWKLDVDIAKVSTVFKQGAAKNYWQVVCIEDGRKIWVQDGKSAFIFDLATSLWSVVPNFPNVHKEANTAVVLRKKNVHVISVNAHVKYHLESKKWKSLNKPTNKFPSDNRRHNCGALVTKGYIFFYSGTQMARYSVAESKWETITPFYGREIHLWAWDHANTIYVWTLASSFDVRTPPRGFVYSINTNKWVEDEDICKPVVSSAFCTEDFDKVGCDVDYEALLLQKYWLVGQGPWLGMHKNSEITEEMKDGLMKLESIPFSERVQYFKSNQASLLPILERALDLVLPFRSLVLIFHLLHEDPSLAEVLLPITKQYKRHFGQYPNGTYWFTLKPEQRNHFGLTCSANNSSVKNLDQLSPSPQKPLRPNFALLQPVRSPSQWTVASPSALSPNSKAPSPIPLSPHSPSVPLSRSGTLEPERVAPTVLTLPPTPTYDFSSALPPITPTALPFSPTSSTLIPPLLPSISQQPSTHRINIPSPRKAHSTPLRPTTSPISPTSNLMTLTSPRLMGAISPSPRGLMPMNWPPLAASLPIQLSCPPSPRDQPHMPSPTSTSTSWALTRSKELKEVENARSTVLQLLKERNIEVPLLYICPISNQLMFDPVTTEDGSMYERKAILFWFTAGNSTSPKTSLALSTTKIYPCPFARSIISDFIAKSLPDEQFVLWN